MNKFLENIPPRSRLYNLPPMGEGTNNTESLTSYVSRLSTAHNLKIGVLFSKIIFPFLNKENFSRNAFNSRRACAYNNYGQRSKDLVKALGDLTSIKNLEHHTLIDFSFFLSEYEVRYYKYWCPFCFQELKDSDLQIFEKLLWSFDAVEVCLEHNCILVCSCPSCNTVQYPLTSNIGFCYKCNSWLGSSEFTNFETLSNEYFTWQKWIIDNISELLLLTKYDRTFINGKWENYSINIKKYINRVLDKYHLTRKEFSLLSNICLSTLNSWEKGKQRASLISLLKICYLTRTSLLQFLSLKYEMSESVKRLPEFIYNDVNYKTKEKLSLEKLRQELTRTIDAKDQPPPSLSQLARSLGYKKSETIRTRLPHESEIIVNNYKKYKHEENVRRKDEIRNIILKLIENDVYPSQKKIEEELGKTSYFWQSPNRKLLNDICNELGVLRKKVLTNRKS